MSHNLSLHIALIVLLLYLCIGVSVLVYIFLDFAFSMVNLLVCLFIFHLIRLRNIRHLQNKLTNINRKEQLDMAVTVDRDL